MTELARRLLAEALALPQDERARLADELYASLPDDFDERLELDPAFAAELTRRAARLADDPAGAIPWDEARERLRASLRR